MSQYTQCQGVAYGAQHADNAVDGGDEGGHGYRRPIFAGGQRDVQIDLCSGVRGGGGVEKGEGSWDRHYGTGCTLASHNSTSPLSVVQGQLEIKQNRRAFKI